MSIYRRDTFQRAFGTFPLKGEQLRRAVLEAGRAEENPSFYLGMTNRPGLMAWGGGVAIFHEGKCMGGIGVSGAQDEEDIDCAMAPIARMGSTGG